MGISERGFREKAERCNHTILYEKSCVGTLVFPGAISVGEDARGLFLAFSET